MKRILNYIVPALLMFAFTACQEEVWTPGEQDSIFCQGVYFPQDQTTDVVFSPQDKKSMTFVVQRSSEKSVLKTEAEVPYELIVSEEGIFELEAETLYFDKDQEKATFKVHVSNNCELGKKYTCTIKVTDPEYVSKYSLSSSELSFSVTVVGWNYLGKGLWRDDVFSGYASAIGAVLTEKNHEKEVDIYERADLKGYYMIDSVYTDSFLAYMVDGNLDNVKAYEEYGKGAPIYLNAVQDNKVYFDLQYAFTCPTGQYGDIYLCSDVDEVMGEGYGSGLYGTVKNGVITFPKNGVYAYVPSADGMAYANTEGKLRIVLPGCKPYDYSINLNYSVAVDGVMPIEFSLGADVAQVKYEVYKGHLSDVEMVSKLEEVKASKDAKVVNASGVYDFTFDETHFYTMIACAYDASGNYQEYDFIKFGYDTKENPKEVDIHMGLIVSDKNTLLGLTAENSMEFYLYGSDIVKAGIAVYKKQQYENFKETIEYSLQLPSYQLDRFQLDSLNTVGYSGVLRGLNPGVEYTLVVFADNGYHSEFFTVNATTEGEFSIFDPEYDMFDIPEKYQPENHDDYLKKWDVWSLDPYNARGWSRSKRAEVEFSDNLDDVFVDESYTVDYLKLKGLHANASKKFGFGNEIDFEFYNGFVYTLMTPMNPVALKADHYELDENGDLELMNKAGTMAYPTNAYLFFTGASLSPNLENGAMVGGFVSEDKDVIVFVGNPSTNAGSYGFSYVAMQLCYYLDDSYSGDAFLVSEDCHAYPMFVSPDSKYATGNAEELSNLSPSKATVALSMELKKQRSNYVETEHGYVKSTIDALSDAMPHNYMENFIPMVVVPEAEPAVFVALPSSLTEIEAPVSEEVKLVRRTILK